MQLSIRILILVLGLCVFGNIFYSLIKRKLFDSAGVMWAIVSIVAMICAIFPQVIDEISHFLKIDYQPTLVLVLIICFQLYLSFVHTNKISIQEVKIRELTIQLSLLKEKNINRVKS